MIAQLQFVTLDLRRVLYEAETPIEAVYFAETGWTSMIAQLEDGLTAEVGLVGREGMVGHYVIVHTRKPLQFRLREALSFRLTPGCRAELRLLRHWSRLACLRKAALKTHRIEGEVLTVSVQGRGSDCIAQGDGIWATAAQVDPTELHALIHATESRDADVHGGAGNPIVDAQTLVQTREQQAKALARGGVPRDVCDQFNRDTDPRRVHGCVDDVPNYFVQQRSPALTGATAYSATACSKVCTYPTPRPGVRC